MATTRTLAHRYIAQRTNRGEIAKGDSARVMLARVLTFANAYPDLPVSRIRRRHVERWMERSGVRDSTKRARFSALHGFVQWCLLNGYIDKDPMVGMKAPTVPDGLPRARAREDVASILAHCPDTRARLCALLMVQEGLRRAEVANAQVADLCLRSGTIAVRGKGGRGVVTRVVPLSAETRSELLRYFAEVGMSAGPVIRSYVQPDRGVLPKRIGEVVTAAMYDAGVKLAPLDGCSPHALRHTTAHDMLDEGAQITEVQEMLG